MERLDTLFGTAHLRVGDGVSEIIQLALKLMDGQGSSNNKQPKEDHGAELKTTSLRAHVKEVEEQVK